MGDPLKYTPEAISERWEEGYQVHDRAGIVVEGQPDPRQDVRALLSEIDRLREPITVADFGSNEELVEAVDGAVRDGVRRRVITPDEEE